MLIQLSYQGKNYQADLSQPLDISLPLSAKQQVKCFHAPDFQTEPLVAGDFIGSVEAGAPVNFFNVHLNPHGNGTHTECMGHLSDKGYTINQELRQFHFLAELISITPAILVNGDQVITLALLQQELAENKPEALIIRTLPNDLGKLQRDYSGTNPSYLAVEAVEWMVAIGVKHLLLDLPSIDREEDGGALAGHKTFWQFPGEERLDCTVTELIFVPNEVEDGQYLLNLQIAAFELDATPSKPVLYHIQSLEKS